MHEGHCARATNAKDSRRESGHTFSGAHCTLQTELFFILSAHVLQE